MCQFFGYKPNENSIFNHIDILLPKYIVKDHNLIMDNLVNS